MPNHVINELIIREPDRAKQNAIIAAATNSDGKIDFEVLLPQPLNIWQSSVSTAHEKFPGNGLDWARKNWGTKWNAYGIDKVDHYTSVVRDLEGVVLTFQTAWSPPYGWIIALFNRFHVDMEHRWLSEGGRPAMVGTFQWRHYEDGGMRGEPWVEKEADSAMHRRLHKFLWGVEEFTDEDEAA